MLPLLTRIEREYIISSLCIDLPELTVVAKNGVCVVQEYRCNEKELAWDTQKYPDCALNETVKILFSHKQRTMSFTSRLQKTPDGIVCAISSDISPEDDVFENTVRIFFPGFGSNRYAAFPVERVRVSRNALAEDSLISRFEALGVKAGLHRNEFPALVFLGHYLESIKSGELRPPVAYDCAHIVHCDHNNLLTVFSSDSRNLPGTKSSIPIRIQWKQRVINGTTGVVTVFPITTSSVILVSRLEHLQEEDKRFLFEMNYTEKYTGE